jgi:hypothetical protein
MQTTQTKKVLFLGEQDGIGERELKTKLAECFSIDDGVESAYLARVSFAEVPMPQVALCLKGGKDKAAALVECAGRVFSKLFKTTKHLDILFLSDAQVTEITRVAKPFYSTSS